MSNGHRRRKVYGVIQWKTPPKNPLDSLAKALLEACEDPAFRASRHGIWMRSVVFGFGEEEEYTRNYAEARKVYSQRSVNRLATLHAKFQWLRDRMDREMEFRSQIFKDDIPF